MTLRRTVRAALALAIPVLGSPGPAAATADGAEVPAGVQEVSLDGEWELGPGRVYTRTVRVPGLATDPKTINDAPLWYRRRPVAGANAAAEGSRARRRSRSVAPAACGARRPRCSTRSRRRSRTARASPTAAASPWGCATSASRGWASSSTESRSACARAPSSGTGSCATPRRPASPGTRPGSRRTSRPVSRRTAPTRSASTSGCRRRLSSTCATAWVLWCRPSGSSSTGWRRPRRAWWRNGATGSTSACATRARG